MIFVSIRDMRTRPGEVWRQLQQEGNLIVTSNGRLAPIVPNKQFVPAPLQKNRTTEPGRSESLRADTAETVAVELVSAAKP